MSYARLLPPQSISSRHLGADRTIRIYLPASYETDPRRRYPVLYMHDGQNIFSSAGPDCCFGWGNWQVDLTADGLAREGKMREIIIVGIDHSGARYQEYRGPAYSTAKRKSPPSKWRANATNENTRFENYAKFLVKELKPFIDKHYRTLARASATGLMGSSLGGICSLALAWQNPRTFGLVASLSGSFQIERYKLVSHELERYRGKRKLIRIYVDSGVIDSSGDEDERHYTERVAKALRKIGWRDQKNLMHFTDDQPLRGSEFEHLGLPHHKRKEAEESQHNEFYWRIRCWRALTFLFPPLK
jgi:predicted alpha/beta superfamily hydrolase